MKRTGRIGVQASNTYIHVQSRMVDEDTDKSFQVTGRWCWRQGLPHRDCHGLGKPAGLWVG